MNINGTIYTDCIRLPFWVSNLKHYAFVLLQIQMLLVFSVTQLLHLLIFRHLGMPPLVSQLFAGIVLGPTGLGRFECIRDVVFPRRSLYVLKSVAMLGYGLSLFLIATTMDFTIIKRTGRKTILIGLLTLISSLVANNVVIRLIYVEEHNLGDIQMATMSLPITGHPVLVRLLTDIGLVNSELGRLSLATGLCVELASIALTVCMNNILPALGNKKELWAAGCKVTGVVALLLSVIFVLRPLMQRLIKLTPQGRPVRDTFVLLAFMSMLLAGLLTDWLGQWVLLGAFMVGGGLPDGPPLGSALVDKYGTFILDVLYPFFVTTCAMRLRFDAIHFGSSLFFNLVTLILVTSVTKITVCFTSGVFFKLARNDALALAISMCCKGFIEIGTMSWLKDMKMISADCFAVLSLHVVLMSFLVPGALNLLYDPMKKYGGYQTRDIMHLKQTSILRMVTCVTKSNHIVSTANLLRIMNPSANAPIVANVLHLIKLSGRCQPLFISHDMQNKQASDLSYSDEVIWQLNRLEHFNTVLSTHVFTAVAQADAMHEYICTLALDKIASLIVLPYHRKYGVEGSIEYDDSDQRSLNSSVLERSPCSVAVLVDRSYVNVRRTGVTAGAAINVHTDTPQALLSVAIIFIGGDDDREALAFAGRMSKGMKVRLTVIRLACPDDHDEFLKSVDSAAIQRLHEPTASGTQRVIYAEMTVTDGVQAALKLRTVVPEYDLIIVGRQIDSTPIQTVGLSESSEIKELGILGDFLSSTDVKSKTSVLVVQQQKHWTS